MRVYHGSIFNIRNPNVERGRSGTDFGKGFYVTTDFEQAKRWALNKQKVADEGAKAIVNIYEISDNLLDDIRFDILKFDSPDEHWLSFVFDSRKGIMHNFDMVFGPVANDRIYATINMYESSLLSAGEAVARLKVVDFFNQISFHSASAVMQLKFIESVNV